MINKYWLILIFVTWWRESQWLWVWRSPKYSIILIVIIKDNHKVWTAQNILLILQVFLFHTKKILYAIFENLGKVFVAYFIRAIMPF